MKTRILFLPVLLLAALLVVAGCKKQKTPAPANDPAAVEEAPDMSQYMPSLQVGEFAPLFEAPDILDETVGLSDFLGDYLVIDFWATWCKDCRAEVPAMKQLYDRFAPRGVQFLGVSFDTDRESLVSYCIENDIAWLQVCNGIKWKENPISADYDLHWIPTMYLLDPDGKILGICFTAKELGKMLATLQYS
jgi:thiol-disulfide isomerase/thioredoxin